VLEADPATLNDVELMSAFISSSVVFISKCVLGDASHLGNVRIISSSRSKNMWLSDFPHYRIYVLVCVLSSSRMVIYVCRFTWVGNIQHLPQVSYHSL